MDYTWTTHLFLRSILYVKFFLSSAIIFFLIFPRFSFSLLTPFIKDKILTTISE